MGAFFCYSSQRICREMYMITPRITNNPKLPARSAKSFNWINTKMNEYSKAKTPATYAASLALPNTLFEYKNSMAMVINAATA